MVAKIEPIVQRENPPGGAPLRPESAYRHQAYTNAGEGVQTDLPWIVRKVNPILDPQGRPISPQLAKLLEILETRFRDKPHAWPGTQWLAERYGCERRNMQLLIGQAVEARLIHRVIEGTGRKSRVGFLALKRFDPNRPVIADNPDAIAEGIAALKADRSGKAQSPAPFARPASSRKAQSAARRKAHSPAPELRLSSNEDENVNVRTNDNVAALGGEESGALEPEVIGQAVPIEPQPVAVATPVEVSDLEQASRFIDRAKEELGINLVFSPGTGADGSDQVSPRNSRNEIVNLPTDWLPEAKRLKPHLLEILKAAPNPDPSPGSRYYAPPVPVAQVASTIENKIRRLRYGVPEEAQALANELANEFAAKWKDFGSVGGFRKRLGQVAKGEIEVKAAIAAYRKANQCGPDAIPGAIWNYWINHTSGGKP